MVSRRRMSLIALFVALSVIGSMVKIPGPIGSVALDAFPALVLAVFIGGKSGALVAAMGHLVSALFAGMPLGPMHLLVAVEMAMIVWLFGVIYQSNKKIMAGALFVFLNGMIASLPFILLVSLPFYLSLLPSLVIGSAFNVILALIFIPRFEPIFNRKFEGVFHESCRE